MNDNVRTSAVIDTVLRFVIGGGAIATILVAPGMAKVLDAPTRSYFKNLDKRQQQRELKRILYYMKQQKLIAPSTKDYMHGLVITKKGRARLQKVDYENLSIPKPRVWDKKWRIVFFDIPEEYRAGRRQLINKFKHLGFFQLQRSVWVHPLPCRQEVEMVASTYNVQNYVSYVEATGIDSERVLREHFKNLLH